jgi:hypothetical protein
MSDKEVEVNGKTYGENTKVTLKVSTLMWIIGGLLSVIGTLATIGYFDIKSDVKEQKDVFEKEKQEYREEIKEVIKQELKDIHEKDVQFVEDIGEIKGDIKVILDRTMRNNDHNNTGYVEPVRENVPELLPVVTDRDNVNGLIGN